MQIIPHLYPRNLSSISLNFYLFFSVATATRADQGQRVMFKATVSMSLSGSPTITWLLGLMEVK
jgi:hypothetical protein